MSSFFTEILFSRDYEIATLERKKYFFARNDGTEKSSSLITNNYPR